MPVAVVNGVWLYYQIRGQGKPVVIITGLGTDSSDFQLITELLAKCYKVLIFDNRGSGKSDKPNEPYSIGLMAEDTAGVMQAAGWQQASIVGVSLGDRIALELAAQHPSMVDKLVLVHRASVCSTAGGVPS